MEVEIKDIGFGTEDKIRYCINVILKEARQEERLVKQIFYHMLSAYTSNPLNLAINAPAGEGKNYVLRKVAENFPKEDVMFINGMTDKALFHRAGRLVIKNTNNGQYEDAERIAIELDARIADLEEQIANSTDKTTKDGLNAQIKSLKEEKEDVYKNAKKLIDLSHKILIFLDTPRSELLNAMMSLLSHDSYEGEYEYADSTSVGIKSRTNVLRGWPVIIFVQALDFSHYKRYPEIQRRFVITNPKMDKEKYKAAIDLIFKKFSYPSHVYEALVVSKAEKLQVQKIIRELRQNLLSVCNSVEPGGNNVIIPFFEGLKNGCALKGNAASDMTSAYRLSSYLSLLPIINLDKRPRIHFRRKGDPIIQIMPFATSEDLNEAMFLMEHASGVRPYIQEWYEQVFLPTFDAKTEPDSKYIPSSDITKTEDMIAVTSEQLVAATQAIQHKTFTNQKILETYLEPLMNEGYIDRAESAINRSWKIYHPTRLNSETQKRKPHIRRHFMAKIE